MSRRLTVATALVLLVGAIFAALALASTFRGAGRDDPEMPVKLTLNGEAAVFEYSDVLVTCTGGTEVRQGGANHAVTVNELGRFKDKLVADGATSVVRGKVEGKKATGVLTYDLVYEEGECHSDKVEWKAQRG